MLLADRAGSGKTVTTLLFLQQLAQARHLSALKPCMIVVPPNLRAQWRDEVRRWTPDLGAPAACPYHWGANPTRPEPQTPSRPALVKAREAGARARRSGQEPRRLCSRACRPDHLPRTPRVRMHLGVRAPGGRECCEWVDGRAVAGPTAAHAWVGAYWP